MDFLANNDLPTTEADPQSAGPGLVEMSVVDYDTAAVTLYIEKLPVQGSLFYSSSDTTVPLSEFDSFYTTTEEQYASKVLEASTFYADAGGGWHPDGTLGPQDAPNKMADCRCAISYVCRAKCGEKCGVSITTGGGFESFDPDGVKRENHADDCWDDAAVFETEGYSQFFTVKYDKKLYINEIEIGENRGMGSVVSIEAWDYTTKTWMVMWTGVADLDKQLLYYETEQYSRFYPTLCQPAFKTDVVKIKMDTLTIDDYNEVDYVKMVGSEKAVPGMLEGNRVWYEEPSGGLDCLDEFSFQASDCGGDSRRMSEPFTMSVRGAGYSGDVLCEVKEEKVAEMEMPWAILGAVIGFTILLTAAVVTRSGMAVASMDRQKTDAIAKLQSAETVIEKQNHELKIALEYSAAEQGMIEAQVKEFKVDLSMAGAAGAGTGTANVDKRMERLLIDASELSGKTMLGSGSFGDVFKSEYRGNDVAVKTLKVVTKDNLNRFQAEIFLMNDLRHPNIVTMLGACWEKALMALVMEFCAKGTSTDVLASEGAHFTWDDPLLKWSMDVSRGMAHLHAITYFDVKTKDKVSGILHRDMKPDNCLVTEQYGIKIADFGEARAIDNENTMTQVGTPLYIAPEVVKGEHYSGKADVFSFALTLLQFALKDAGTLKDFLIRQYEAEFPKLKREVNLSRISHHLVVSGWRPSLEILENKLDVPRCIVDLLSICWADNQMSRPSFHEIVEYIEVDCKKIIMEGTNRSGGSGGGSKEGTEVCSSHNTRRTSTSGGLQVRIANHRHKQLEASFDADDFKDCWDSIELLRDKVKELSLDKIWLVYEGHSGSVIDKVQRTKKKAEAEEGEVPGSVG